MLTGMYWYPPSGASVTSPSASVCAAALPAAGYRACVKVMADDWSTLSSGAVTESWDRVTRSSEMFRIGLEPLM